MGARALVLRRWRWCVRIRRVRTSAGPAQAAGAHPGRAGSLSQVLEPLLTAAGLWRGPADGCAAAFGVVEGEPIGAEVIPHAPCRVKLDPHRGRADAARSRDPPRGARPRARPHAARPPGRAPGAGGGAEEDREGGEVGEQGRLEGRQLHSRRGRVDLEGDRHGAGRPPPPRWRPTGIPTFPRRSARRTHVP